MIDSIKEYWHSKGSMPAEKPASEAYDAWSASYDCQPGNLMLDLDKIVFTDLIKNVTLENKRVADVGCGTGRHWEKLYSKQPNLVIGFDVSEGMLLQLARKFPAAITKHITNNLLEMVPNTFVDCLVSTLTIAHIKNIQEAIGAWSRITKDGGDLIITDFHPAILSKGGKRSFKHEGKSMAVTNYVHSLPKVKKAFAKHGFAVIKQEEKYVNEEVKHYYAAQNALHVYERYKNMPVIYGLHLKKEYAAE
ncbi:MAG: class I SAM-dependent methyltransferase [Bacteroidota bacterium]